MRAFFFWELRPELGLSSVTITCNKPKSLAKEFHIKYYNARSLLSKLDELRAISETTKPDVICIVETWLDNEITDNEICLTNYHLFRLDRNRHGGGIAIYVHSFLSCNVILQGGPFGLELLSLSISSHLTSCKFCSCLFYHPLSSPVSIFDNLCTTLQIVNPARFHSFVLLGDFNVNFVNKDHHLFTHVSDILYTFSLTQVVPSYTYISPTGSPSLIEYALLSDTQLLVDCATKLFLHSQHLTTSGLDLHWSGNYLQQRPVSHAKFGFTPRVIMKGLA